MLLKKTARLLKTERKTIATAESVTGGLIAKYLTDLPGSSVYFQGGVVCYNDGTKRDILGLAPSLLANKTAVSREVTEAMARAVRERFQTDLGLATTGVAGPDSLTKKKVGEVYVALSYVRRGGKTEVLCQPRLFTGNRTRIREQAAQAALQLVLRVVKG